MNAWIWIDDLITKIMSYNYQCVENTIKILSVKGCSCCNNNDLTKFTLVYIENEFAYIECNVCNNHIYTKNELITTDMMKKWIEDAAQGV